ncbi:hypothetical protein JRO89_XS07G0291400 [Xanthoceras sorbifolium]|uniref:Uncharacterized protein n=1 Tax=Xanthoceras sorbifolium TaxID=99658 RepID=A0ABQ8HVK3_9ROSI|nr:hypothetical protein JRO89_XS07G0291400 [Xanthoceras sorbifolium]
MMVWVALFVVIMDSNVKMGIGMKLVAINPNNSGLGCSYNEVSIKFYLENNNFEKLECCEVTKCGVRLLYVQDIGEPSGSFRSDDEDEFWDCMETPSESLLSSDDEDQFWEAMEEH